LFSSRLFLTSAVIFTAYENNSLTPDVGRHLIVMFPDGDSRVRDCPKGTKLEQPFKAEPTFEKTRVRNDERFFPDDRMTEKENVDVRRTRFARCARGKRLFPDAAQFPFYPVAFRKEFTGSAAEPGTDDEVQEPPLAAVHSKGLRFHHLRPRKSVFHDRQEFPGHFLKVISAFSFIAPKTEKYRCHSCENRFFGKQSPMDISTVRP
jgi:hypothetical protein